MGTAAMVAAAALIAMAGAAAGGGGLVAMERAVRPFHEDAAVSRRLDSSNITQAPAVCVDPPDAFATLTASGALSLGSRCYDVLDRSSVYFPRFFNGGLPEICQATTSAWLEAASQQLLFRISAAWSSPFGLNGTMAALCPSTCSRAGVLTEACQSVQPPPLPSPPPAPPRAPNLTTSQEATNADQLRQALGLASAVGVVSIYIPPGTTIDLRGGPLVVARANVSVWSTAQGAVLDAGDESCVAEIWFGGSLQLQSITLANGRSNASGGAITVRQGTLQMSRCLVENASSAVDCGAVLVLNSRVHMSQSVIRGGLGFRGGAFLANGASVVLLRDSSIESCTATVGGGVYFSPTVYSEFVRSKMSHITGYSGGFLFNYGPVLINGSVISHCRAFQFGAAMLHTLSLATVVQTAFSECHSLSCAVLVNSAFSSVIMDSCTFTNITGQVSAGLLCVTVGSCMMTTCTIVDVELPAFHVSGGSVVVRDSSLSHLMTPQSGAAVRVDAGSIVLDHIEIAHSSAAKSGGAIWVNGFGKVLVTNGSSITDCFAPEGGAIAVEGGTLEIVNGCTISSAAASSLGGALYIAGGSVTVSHGCTITFANAAIGGCVMVELGVLVLDGSAIANCSCVTLGAGIAVYGGTVTMKRSTITGAFSDVGEGGAFYVSLGDVTVADGSEITHSKAWQGGGLTMYGGTFTMTDSLFAYSAAQHTAGQQDNINGGALSIAGGHVAITRCNISHSIAQEGGAIAVTGGELHLTYVLVEDSVSDDANVVFIDGVIDPSLLVVFTFVTVKQTTCRGPLFVQRGGGQLVVHRLSFSFVECTLEGYNFSDAFRGVVSKQCGDTYVGGDAAQHGVCASATATACTSQSIAGSSVVDLACVCPWPETPSRLFDAELAPYLPSGCVSPLLLTDVSIVAKSVVVTLSKPLLMQRSVNVTITVDGDGDEFGHPATWSVPNASVLSSMGTEWLNFERTSGAVVTQGEPVQLQVPLTVIASGLRERAIPYTAQIPIQFRSAIAQTYLLEVSLGVEALSSFVVWNQAGWDDGESNKCENQLDTVKSSTYYAGQIYYLPFTACDVDSLPVDHRLPTPSDPREFRASLKLGQDAARAVQIQYASGGTYEVELSITTWGSPTLSLELAAQTIDALSIAITCPLDRVPLPDGECGCADGLYQVTRSEPCVPCTPPSVSSFQGALGVDGCNICSAGHYRLSAFDDVKSCSGCPEGVRCEPNATLQTMTLDAGFWRLSPQSSKISRCENSSLTCLGGYHEGRCAAGFIGPLCKSCNATSQYYERGRCIDCPEVSVIVVSLLSLVIGVPVVFLCIWSWFRSQRWCIRASIWADDLGLGCKLRILIAFVQCVRVSQSVNSFNLPQGFLDAFRFVRVVSIDLAQLFPDACFGSFNNKLIVTICFPFIVIVVITLMHAAVCRLSHRLVYKPIHSLGPILWIVFLMAPGVSLDIFSSWDCEAFELSIGQRLYFIRRFPSIQCYSPQHSTVQALASLGVAIWPVGSVALFTLLSLRVRTPILEHSPDEFVRSSRFLHGDFKAEYYFWTSIELAHRLVLTGWLLMIDAEKTFFRIIGSILAAFTFLVWTMAAQPYRRTEDNILASAASAVLTLVFVCGLLIKVHDDFLEEVDSAIVNRVLGSLSTTGLVWVIGGLTISILVLFVATVMNQVPTERLTQLVLLKSSNKPPVLSLSSAHKWMLFLSHVWTTGQDQAAFIKRQLQRMLPSVSIFLDVDDLESISKLEDSIERSGCVLIFLSKGYMLSRNCVREAKTALSMEKPRVVVWEADRAKGGASRQELRVECPSELVAIFEDDFIRWYRSVQFQLMSLKLIVERMLLASPHYKGSPELQLKIQGEVIEEKMRLPLDLVVYASSANAGASSVAMEFCTYYPKVPFIEQRASLMNYQVQQRPKGHLHFKHYRLFGGGALAVPRASTGLVNSSSSLSTLMRPSVATHFLLYLTRHTFDGDTGNALAEELRLALTKRMPIILVHEEDEAMGGCEFSMFFQSTPLELLRDGLYNDLAVPLSASKFHRPISFALIARKLAARDTKTPKMFGHFRGSQARLHVGLVRSRSSPKTPKRHANLIPSPEERLQGC